METWKLPCQDFCFLFFVESFQDLELHVKSLDIDIKTVKTLGLFWEFNRAMLGLFWEPNHAMLGLGWNPQFLVLKTSTATLDIPRIWRIKTPWQFSKVSLQYQYHDLDYRNLSLSVGWDLLWRLMSRPTSLGKQFYLQNVKNATSIWKNIFRIKTSKKWRVSLSFKLLWASCWL